MHTQASHARPQLRVVPRAVPETSTAIPRPRASEASRTERVFGSPAGVLGLAGLMLALDFLSGPYILFPILYVVPILLAAWYRGARWALPLAVAMPLVRLVYDHHWQVPWVDFEAWVNGGIRVAVLSTMAVLTARTAAQTRELAREVRMLEGLLPICSHCKRIRDEDDRWERLEQYITARSEARFSHSICPCCVRQHYTEFADD